MRRIEIFDTTLRDGEQSPGVALNAEEKLLIAHQLGKLGVNVLEAGFPIASPGDFEGVRRIAQEVRNVGVAALARANAKDIERAWEAISGGESPRIHTFIATSPIHMQYKLQKSPDEVFEQAVQAVRLAKSKVSDIEFSAEDASRSNVDFLARVFSGVIQAGATVLNVPDTVGYATPEEYAAFLKAIMERTTGIEKVKVSVHCHNDLGLAVANSLAAVGVGVHQLECTVNGIGERAGNAALEELVMALHTRRDQFDVETSIVTSEIARTSQLVSRLTGMMIQHNKAIVGKNAFAHESGIHQDGMLKERSTYEIMSPSIIGVDAESIVLGKHSGRHAVQQRLADLGLELEDSHFEELFSRFKLLADRKREVTTADLFSLVDEQKEKNDQINLDYLQISSGTHLVPTATVGLMYQGQRLADAACGDGPVDAAFKAIDKVLGTQGKLSHYSLQALDGGEDAQGEVTVSVKFGENLVAGRGVSTDIIEASVRGYLQAVNRAYTRGWIEIKQ
ncbi:2-isopropylmalate synthase [Desulfosporosinus meridiei]|uniref:2-isopropylmalate synthase n=1 Tax=Desulfosporosinus meridiei (strain ATCC BAA-275 / DSM 13257 / KCTC 12902 / NCIMB 13706 / S10) TaxID=768704 RepID=J7J162_DESMD|nr:2-isopropylmalate synthase [Desulfosporosinus meridiei]AFQ44701.1 2-isopropylmalate synthase [Desulfosporosinus meridiei DSM 13257]